MNTINPGSERTFVMKPRTIRYDSSPGEEFSLPPLHPGGIRTPCYTYTCTPMNRISTPLDGAPNVLSISLSILHRIPSQKHRTALLEACQDLWQAGRRRAARLSSTLVSRDGFEANAPTASPHWSSLRCAYRSVRAEVKKATVWTGTWAVAIGRSVCSRDLPQPLRLNPSTRPSV